MSHYSDSIPQVTCQEPKSRLPYAVKYGFPERVIMGKKIRDHSATLEELAACAALMKKPTDPESGRQELFKQIMNEVLFG